MDIVRNEPSEGNVTSFSAASETSADAFQAALARTSGSAQTVALNPPNVSQKRPVTRIQTVDGRTITLPANRAIYPDAFPAKLRFVDGMLPVDPNKPNNLSPVRFLNPFYQPPVVVVPGQVVRTELGNGRYELRGVITDDNQVVSLTYRKEADGQYTTTVQLESDRARDGYVPYKTINNFVPVESNGRSPLRYNLPARDATDSDYDSARVLGLDGKLVWALTRFDQKGNIVAYSEITGERLPRLAFDRVAADAALQRSAAQQQALTDAVINLPNLIDIARTQALSDPKNQSVTEYAFWGKGTAAQRLVIVQAFGDGSLAITDKDNQGRTVYLPPNFTGANVNLALSQLGPTTLEQTIADIEQQVRPQNVPPLNLSTLSLLPGTPVNINNPASVTAVLGDTGALPDLPQIRPLASPERQFWLGFQDSKPANDIRNVVYNLVRATGNNELATALENASELYFEKNGYNQYSVYAQIGAGVGDFVGATLATAPFAPLIPTRVIKVLLPVDVGASLLQTIDGIQNNDPRAITTGALGLGANVLDISNVGRGSTVIRGGSDTPGTSSRVNPETVGSSHVNLIQNPGTRVYELQNGIYSGAVSGEGNPENLLRILSSEDRTQLQAAFKPLQDGGVDYRTWSANVVDYFNIQGNGQTLAQFLKPGTVGAQQTVGASPEPQDPIHLARQITSMSTNDLQQVTNGANANEFRMVLRHATELAGAPYRENMGISKAQHAVLSNNLTVLRDAWLALSPAASMPDLGAARDLPRTLTASQVRQTLLADGINPDRADDFINQSNGLYFYWPNDQIAGLPQDFYSPDVASGNIRIIEGQARLDFENALNGPLYPLPEGGFIVAPQLPPNTQLFVMGDVHGTSNLYNAIQSAGETLTAQGRQQPGESGPPVKTIIVSVGDLGNKGPDTAAVSEDLLAKVSRYANDPNTDFLILSGNHEDPRTYGTLLDVNADIGNPNVRTAIQDILKKGGYLTLQSFENKAIGRGERGFSVDVLKAPAPGDASSIPYYQQLQQDIARIVPRDYRELALNLPLARTYGDFFLSHGGGDPRSPRFSIDPETSLGQLSPDQDFMWTRLPELAAGAEGSISFNLSEPLYPLFGHTMNIRPAQTPFGFDLDASAFRAWQMAGLFIPPNGSGQAQIVIARQADGVSRDVQTSVIPIETAIGQGFIDTRFDNINLVPNREGKPDQPMINSYMNLIPQVARNTGDITNSNNQATSPRFISQPDPYRPDATAFNNAIEDWTAIVLNTLSSPDASQQSLQNILSKIEPRAQVFAREQFANQPDIRNGYGAQSPGGRNTVLNYSIFQGYIPPTLRFIQRDWSNVYNPQTGQPPSFPANEFIIRIMAGDPEAINLVHFSSISTPSGLLPTAMTIITPPDPNLLNNPLPFTITTNYPARPENIESIKSALSSRWGQLQAIPVNDPQAIPAIADFLYDYNKLYWHSYGNGDISNALMAGYLTSKGFNIQNINPGIDINSEAFHNTREEYIQKFTNGEFFQLTPGTPQSNLTNNKSLIASSEGSGLGVDPVPSTYRKYEINADFQVSTLSDLEATALISNYDALSVALASVDICFLEASSELFNNVDSADIFSKDKQLEEGLAISLDKPVIELPEITPVDERIAQTLRDVASYLGWAQSLISQIDPKIAAQIGKAIALAQAGDSLIAIANGKPGSIDDAAFALFNVAASLSPEVAKLAPYVNTGRQALNLIVALTTPQQVVQIGGQNFINAGGGKFFAQNVAGFGTASSIAGLTGGVASLLKAPQAVVDALNGAAILFQGISLIGAVGATVPIIGWAVSLTTFIFGLFSRNKEQWSKWQTVLTDISVDGGQNSVTGEILQNDSIDQKTSNKKRNKVAYTGQASEAPIQTAGFTLRPETVLQADPNGTVIVGRGGGGRMGGSHIDIRLEDGSQVRLYARGTDENTGEAIWGGSDGNDGWITRTESQLVPQIEVATGNYILDLNVNFAAINPDVKVANRTLSITVSAEQALQLRTTFGADSTTIGGNDARIASLEPFIAQVGAVRWETDHTTPNVYTYDDFNRDGVPDMFRQGILDGLRVDNDGKFEVFINSSIGSPQFSYTANSQEEAYQTGIRANILMLYTASHPELYDLYLSQPQANAAGNIALIYQWAQGNGVLSKLDQILALSGAPQGATLTEQLLDMANKGAQIAQLKQELGISVDPLKLDSYPDLAAAFNHNTLQLLNHYIQYGNSEGRAVNDAGQVLARWQPRADGWSNLQSLAYIASHGDLMDAFGPNADAGRAHWSNHGRWESRGANFSIDAYLASRPDVRAAAIAALTVTPQAAIQGGGGRMGGSYIDVPLSEGGTARLYARGTDDNTGEAIWAGSDGNDGWISMTQSQIDALTRAVAPGEDEIRVFGLTHYITTGRYEAAGVAPPQPAVVTAPATTIIGDRAQNRFIAANEALQSANGRYMAVMQSDGNFVVYDGGSAIWASNTAGRAGGGAVAIQGDGNLVVYAPGNDAKWASDTSAADVNRAFNLVMQDDGNLVLYDTQGVQALWSSMTGRVTVPQPNAQFQSRGWSDLTALTYVASYVDLANAFGVNAEAGRAHYTNHGHGESRGVTFNVDAYLASRPDVRNAAIAGLSQPGVAIVPSDGESLAYVDVPTADGGRARLYTRGTDENSGEAIWAGSDGNDGYIRMTQSQIDALAAPVPPSEDAIRLFAVQHYIANGRFEMAQAA